MTFDPTAHNTLMVNRFIWLETQDPDYARDALERYRRDPGSPNANILADIRAEKARRAQLKTLE